MSLKLDETIQKAFLSSTAKFIDEFKTESCLLTHAFPDFRDSLAINRRFSDPNSRCAFIYVFKTDPIDRTGAATLIPNYSWKGDVLASYLSVLFGKRFDHHGLLEGSGCYQIPDLSQFNANFDSEAPHNSNKVRVDYPIPLELSEFSRLKPLWECNTQNERFEQFFRIAAKFYLQALQNFDRDPEVSYLHLITVGEILSNFDESKKNANIDHDIELIFERIKKGMEDGAEIVNKLKGKMRSIKKKFVNTIVELVKPDFFNKSESKVDLFIIKPDNFKEMISSAYDIRSKYVHTGAPFKNSINYSAFRNFEVNILSINEVKGIKEYGLTLMGLERIIRYCLLKFAEENGGYIDPSTLSK
jgi:hypothetical protein